MSKMTIPASRLVSSRVRARCSVKIDKQKSFRRITKAFSCGLSIMLVAQGLALSSNVFAQTKRQTPVVSHPQPVTAGTGDAPRSRQRSIMPARRPIGVLPPINMQGLSNQRGLAPELAAPRQLKPIHPPKGKPEWQKSRKVVRGGGDSAAPRPPLAPVPTVPSPPVSQSFKSDNLTLGSIPPDTMGAVGEDHVVTVTNEKVVVHDRNGLVLSTVTLDAFWASTPSLPSPSTFDPKILYDRFNDRFIFVTQANPQEDDSATLIATTQTADPTGTWNRYFIDADPLATPVDPGPPVTGGGKWADYPSIGFNANWITVQINLFGFGAVSGYQGPAIYVLNKADAYDGTPFTFSAFEGDFPTDCLTSVTPETELGCGFTMVPHVDEGNTTGAQYVIEDWDSQLAQLRISTLTGTAALPVLTVGTQFPQSPNSWRFNSSLIAGSGGYVPQRQQNVYLPSGSRPTANDSRIQNAVLRNGSLWTTHHVMVAATPTLAGTAVGGAANPDIRTAVQWWEIDPTLLGTSLVGTPPIQRGLIEDPTADNCHNGSGGLRAMCTTLNQVGDFYTFPSISVNQNDDLLIGYSRFSPLTLAKAAYSFRASGDAANTMRDSAVFREGQGNYNIGAGSPFNIRWGDFSQTMVDPLNDTDFWTIQEYALDQREIFGPGGFAGLWSTWWSLIKPSSTTSYTGSLIISEFRLSGPAGPRDEFVELYNPGSGPVTVSTTDGSEGWALAFSNTTGTVTPLAIIPNGMTIPARGHFLISNEVRATGIAPYSLNGYPNTEVRQSDSDAMYTPDLTDNGGVAIFSTANPANFSAATRMDSAGFAATPTGLFKEGAGIPDITGTPTSDISFVRKMTTGSPQDTGDNAADFVFISTESETLGVASSLGAPGPENLDSPIQRNSTIAVTLLDPLVSALAPTNRFRDLTSDPGNNSTFGTLSIRRTIRNDTGGNVTRLRFRVVVITSGTAPAGIADLRLRTSSQTIVTIAGPNPACPVNSCTVVAMTLEEPPSQTNAGGLNSTLSAGTVTLATPITPASMINVQFLLGIQQTGFFRFFVNIEALP